MSNKSNLQGKPVLFKMSYGNRLHEGRIVEVEDDGFWIESKTVLFELAEDASWKRAYSPFVEEHPGPLVLFVPLGGLVFLLAERARASQSPATPRSPVIET